MSKIVRQSKFRHVFGTQFKPELCYSELRPEIGANDSSNYIKVNSSYIAVPWQGGGGSVAIIPHAETGKRSPEQNLLAGHSGQIVDLDFNPFNDSILATASTDQTVKIWGIPEGGLKETVTKPLVNLEGHDKKLLTALFHPTASNVLLSAAVDNTIILWDIETAKQGVKFNDSHTQQIQSICYNRDGSQLITTCKDKKLRLFDPRAGKVSTEAAGHEGTKGSRACWLGRMERLITVGFTKLSERQYMLWDSRNMAKPIRSEQIDVSSGVLMPFFDEDTQMLYLSGKGDGNIRYYEMVDEEPYVYLIDDMKSSTAARGMAMAPKLMLDTSICETTRLYKLTNNQVLPIMFQVPRKAETFQADIFPDTIAPEASETAAEYFEGKNAEPKTCSMKPGENPYAKKSPMSAFTPKVVEQPKTPKLPPKTSDPKELAAQNEELRKRVEALELENAELKKKLEAAPQTP